MRDFLTSGRRWLAVTWFWPLVLLALPNCSSLIGVEDWSGGPTANFDPGPEPRTTAVMCDIAEFVDQCLQLTETGIALQHAAIALVRNESSAYGLDVSDSAIFLCNGFAGKTVFYGGSFPDGSPVCVNPGQFPSFGDGNGVCVAQCKDLHLAMFDGMGQAEIDAWCQAHARVSTNFDKTSPFTGACDSTGHFLNPPDFVDPRRTPEDTSWTDGIKTTDSGSSLTRPATSEPPTGQFDAGAVSKQFFQHGDGWVDFGASEIGVSHVLGLSAFDCETTDPCTAPHDVDGSLLIGFAISLNMDGRYYLIEGGNLVNGPDINGSYGTYAAHDRFRIHFDDKLNGTAAISYWWLECPSPLCVEHKIADSAGTVPYPFRVDTSFREPNATLENVTLVYIKGEKVKP